MTDEANRKAKAEYVDDKRPRLVEPETDEQLDEDERALRALRIDLPGSAGVPSGIISMAVTDRMPKKEFFRCHPTNTVVVPMVDHVRGMDVEYNIVAPPMVSALASIDIDALPYRLWQILTVEGASVIIPVRQADLDGSQNSWNQTKETALVRAQSVWLRVSTDKPNGRYRVFEAPAGRFGEPVFPDLSMAKIIRMAFTDRGRLIDSPEHPLFLKWAARDAES
jgi:hypothetical protein